MYCVPCFCCFCGWNMTPDTDAKTYWGVHTYMDSLTLWTTCTVLQYAEPLAQPRATAREAIACRGDVVASCCCAAQHGPRLPLLRVMALPLEVAVDADAEHWPSPARASGQRWAVEQACMKQSTKHLQSALRRDRMQGQAIDSTAFASSPR